MGDWWYNAIPLMKGAQGNIARWVLEQEWAPNTVFKKPSSYHITTVYSYDGRDDARLSKLLDAYRIPTFVANAESVEAFTPRPDTPGALVPVVIRLAAPGLESLVQLHLDAFEEAGFEVSRWKGGYKPHVTVALVDPIWEPKIRVSKMTPPTDSYLLDGTLSKTGGYRG